MDSEIRNDGYNVFGCFWDMKDGIIVTGFDKSTQENVDIHFTNIEEFKKWGNDYLDRINER